MKRTTSFALGALTGMGILAAYDRYGCKMKYDIKKAVNKIKKEADNNIENMM